MSDKSPTPDLLPRFHRASRLDKTEHGTVGRDNAPVVRGATDIRRSPAGPKDKMDSNKSTGGRNFEASLGAEESGTATHVETGGRAPKADFGFLRKG